MQLSEEICGKTHFSKIKLFPIGFEIRFGNAKDDQGKYIRDDIPEQISGCLKCDGSKFDKTEYPDLFNVLKSETLPNDENMFIVAKH